ncbi:MAG: hypothetical protein NWP79_11260, partial [Paracoccaceae bacterium]|nr:hypothetical protein [Paracoccaceae bacterium]
DALGLATYFCDAYASWQKGGIENANGRIRRWLPRQTNLDALSDEEIQDVAMTLNLTPRKCLGFRSPAEAFLNELDTRNNPLNLARYDVSDGLGISFWPDRCYPGSISALLDGVIPWRFGVRERPGGQSCRRCLRG